jgi:hypothetical protein
MAEDDRVGRLERWCAELDEELSRLRTILAAVGVVATGAARRESRELPGPGTVVPDP